MANVFGDPITDSTLKKMPEYVNKEITAVDRARVAISMKNTNARTSVENLKKEDGINDPYCHTYIYNGTGNPMTFVGSREWHGYPYKPYPLCIQNGQWAGFWSVKDTFGSVAGVVYRAKNANDIQEYDHMAAWSNPWPSKGRNSVWTETREKGHYKDDEWKKIHDNLAEPRSNWSDSWNGCQSDITITTDICGEVEATFSLDLLSTMPDSILSESAPTS